jgi:hypothetical protein
MVPLTLQEVIEKIRNEKGRPFSLVDGKSQERRVENGPHRPEFYIPRIALRLANLKFSFTK